MDEKIELTNVNYFYQKKTNVNYVYTYILIDGKHKLASISLSQYLYIENSISSYFILFKSLGCNAVVAMPRKLQSWKNYKI